jgi:hypothetical protein
VKRSLSGKDQRHTTIIHRTVRWCTGLSGEPTITSATVGHAIRGRRVARTNGRQGGTGLSDVHRTVSGAPSGPKLQRSTAPYLEGNRASDNYSDCPVHHTTEGKISLPRLSSTAPSCLGAIKGTPRRMEESPKHSLSNLKHPDSAPTHLIICVSDLSSICVANSMCCTLSSSCDLCAWLCCGFESCVCSSPLPYFCASFVIIIVRARGSKLWRFLANGRKTKKESRGIQVDHWIA